MAPTSNILRAARPVFRQTTGSSSSSFFSSQTQQSFFRQQFRQQGKRWQSTASSSEQQSQSWFKKAWESEVGIKTVHFWAPVMKWALVLAGISDLARPAEKLSFAQNFSLTCTGIIWTRWCFVIRPKNYLLAAVNFFLALVGITQITRIGMHNMSKKDEEAPVEVKA
ncbi:Mitochondrial pyruvate carrier 3 [Trichoderma ghanense]|uniref:Mitochondrial pyruvate carrier n=1 Tax=Trichoderma ghanense TaxID=65468 RepID=A0ABY2GZB9_9HYPO